MTKTEIFLLVLLGLSWLVNIVCYFIIKKPGGEIKMKEKTIKEINKAYIETYKREREKEKEIANIRHQVCEEIRDLAGNYFEFPICENCGETLFASNDVIITGSDFAEILDQIEGENDDN